MESNILIIWPSGIIKGDLCSFLAIFYLPAYSDVTNGMNTPSFNTASKMPKWEAGPKGLSWRQIPNMIEINDLEFVSRTGVFLGILDAYRPLKAPPSSRKINPKLRQIIKSVENIIPALENGHYPLTKTVLIK